ncbi:MAG: M20/M25/M40 family metallo-hydrolase [Thermoleophilia bacterium]
MSEAKVAARARDSLADVWEVLPAWAAIASSSGDPAGLTAMLAALRARAEHLPGTAREARLDRGGPAALYVSCRPDAPRRVLLVGHMDTVHGPDVTAPPIERRGDVLTGPGVADMKGGLLVMLAALDGFEASPHAPRLGWDLIVTPDEELGSPLGAPFLADAAGDVHWGLVFEPAGAGGGVVIQRRGRSVLRIDVTGRSAHAGRDPASGRNAVTALAELVLAAEAMGAPDSHLDVTVGTARGGSQVNVVPDRAVAEIDVRAQDAAPLADVAAELRRVADDVVRRREVQVEVREVVGCPPMSPTPVSERLARAYGGAARTVGIDAPPVRVGGVSDANHLAGAGLSVIDGLGPVGGGLHSPDEWVDVPSILDRAAAAAVLLHRLATDDEHEPG